MSTNGEGLWMCTVRRWGNSICICVCADCFHPCYYVGNNWNIIKEILVQDHIRMKYISWYHMCFSTNRITLSSRLWGWLQYIQTVERTERETEVDHWYQSISHRLLRGHAQLCIVCLDDRALSLHFPWGIAPKNKQGPQAVLCSTVWREREREFRPSYENANFLLWDDLCALILEFAWANVEKTQRD